MMSRVVTFESKLGSSLSRFHLESLLMSNVATANPPQVWTPASSSGVQPGHQRINKVAVLGAGTMGARIAAHFANAQVPCNLLELVSTGCRPKSDKAPSN